jgi:nitroimidazol reductase NimA-like FMN-containing flavoprotein (pyridoxamine 5'-phosphate oxidase superfamily)
MGQLHDLDHSACEELLRLKDVGRVAVCAPDGPHVVPVNYAVTQGAVVIRTSPYSILGTYGREHTVALEVDHLDHQTHEGWSVQVRGRASMVADPDDIQRIRMDWDPEPWADGSRRLYIRLPWQELTGRLIGPGPT